MDEKKKGTKNFTSFLFPNFSSTTWRQHSGTAGIRGKEKQKTKQNWFDLNVEKKKKNWFLFSCQDFASCCSRYVSYSRSQTHGPLAQQFRAYKLSTRWVAFFFSFSLWAFQVTFLNVRQSRGKLKRNLKIHFPCWIALCLSASLAHKSSIEWHYKDTNGQKGLLTESLQWFNALCHTFLISRASALGIFISVTFLLPLSWLFQTKKIKEIKTVKKMPGYKTHRLSSPFGNEMSHFHNSSTPSIRSADSLILLFLRGQHCLDGWMETLQRYIDISFPTCVASTKLPTNFFILFFIFFFSNPSNCAHSPPALAI